MILSPYKVLKKLVPSMTWDVIEFFNNLLVNVEHTLPEPKYHCLRYQCI